MYLKKIEHNNESFNEEIPEKLPFLIDINKNENFDSLEKINSNVIKNAKESLFGSIINKELINNKNSLNSKYQMRIPNLPEINNEIYINELNLNYNFNDLLNKCKN